MTATDRLTRDTEPIYRGDAPHTIDEIVLTGAAVHLERLSRKNWMLIIENGTAHFHLTLHGTVIEYEMLANGRQLSPDRDWNAS